MPQANVIKHKRSSTSGQAPTTGQLDVGEIAINLADSKIYTKDGSDNILTLSSGPNNKTFTFGGTGTPTTGNVAPYLYVDKAQNCVSLTLLCKTAPSGGSFAISILKSTNNGSTFPTTVGSVTITTANTFATTTTFTTSTLSAGDFLRIDITSVNGAADWTCQLVTKD